MTTVLKLIFMKFFYKQDSVLSSFHVLFHLSFTIVSWHSYSNIWFIEKLMWIEKFGHYTQSHMLNMTEVGPKSTSLWLHQPNNAASCPRQQASHGRVNRHQRKGALSFPKETFMGILWFTLAKLKCYLSLK